MTFFILLFIAKGVGLFSYFYLGLFEFESILVFGANPITALLLAHTYYRVTQQAVPAYALFLMDTLVPVYGFLAITIFSILLPIIGRFHTEEEEDDDEFPLGVEHYERFTLEKRVRIEKMKKSEVENMLHDSFKIQPYMDIFDGRDILLKLNAVDKLGKLPRKGSITLLKHVLNDPDYEVRYFANNTIDKIEKNLLNELQALSENIKIRPNDHTNYNIRGSSYLHIYKLGILDQKTNEFFLEKALADFLFSIQLKGKQSNIYAKIAEAYSLGHNYEKLMEITNEALKMNLEPGDKTRILYFRSESEFKKSKYHHVLDDLADLRPTLEKGTQLVERTSFDEDKSHLVTEDTTLTQITNETSTKVEASDSEETKQQKRKEKAKQALKEERMKKSLALDFSQSDFFKDLTPVKEMSEWWNGWRSSK
jgi:hypothetical protein